MDLDLEQRWAAWLLDRNRRGTKTLLWIVITLYPSFAILDLSSARFVSGVTR